MEESQYDWKAICKYLLLALSVMLAWKMTDGIGAVAIVFLVLWSVFREKPIELMFWVLFMTLTTTVNRQLLPMSLVPALVVRGTLMALSVLLFMKLFGAGRDARLISPFLGILVYMVWETAISAQGFAPTISYLKVVLFFMVFFAMYGTANVVNRSTRSNAKLLRSAALALICLMIFGSILLIPFPGISYLSTEEALQAMLSGDITSLYKGMTCHSQVLGSMAGIIGTFVFADLVFSIKKWDKLYIALLFCSMYLDYKTSSRTGMGTLIAGIGMVVFLALRARGLGRNWRGKLLMTLNILTIVATIAVIALPALRGKVAQFALKYDRSGANNVTMEEVMSTRQGAIDNAMYNFRKKPWTGNGFQVSDEMEGQKRDGLLQYLSAPIEKGVWLYAILEEGGIPGMALFVGWLVVLFWLLITRHSYIGASVFFSFLVANLGEFSIFSTGYIGGFYWTLTFAATCLDVQRMKATNIQIFDVPIAQVISETGIDMWTRRLG